MERSDKAENEPAKNAVAWAEELRARFGETVRYDMLERADIRPLCTVLNTMLMVHEIAGGMSMAVSSVKVKRDDDGRLRAAFIRVDGPYFEDREAVSFNADGFVGIAGWADSKNSVPFLRAFETWLGGTGLGSPEAES